MDYQRPSEEQGSTEASRPNVSFQPDGQNQNQQANPPLQVPELPQSKNLSDKLRPYRWYIAIVGVVIIAVLFGAYSYLKYTNEKLFQEVVPTFTPRIFDETADWKTYTNIQYGFEFKYPADWSLIVNSSAIQNVDFAVSIDSVLSKQPVDTDLPFVTDVRVYSNISQLDWKKLGVKSLSDYLDKYSTLPNLTIQNIEEINLGNQKGYKAVAGPNTFGGGIYYYVQVDNYIYEIWQFQSQDKILSTFKFTDLLFCGGIAGKLCPSGYNCKLDGSYPDAGGICILNSNTGILTGHVTIGPNCPVERVGVSCTPAPEAYTSRRVSVYKADGITLVTTQNFDVRGNYSIALPVGTYVIKSRIGIGSIDSVIGTVTIKNGQTSTLNFAIDTGIR